jgi:DNA-binding transcriptional LysR family regulator
MQGAVSHQIKALETELAIKLFNRERQRLVITEAGRDYLDYLYLNVVRDALDRIAVGTGRLLQRQSAGVLTVSTSPDFAAKWLVHRLGNFAEAHAGIDLRVSATLHHVDFAREVFVGPAGEVAFPLRVKNVGLTMSASLPLIPQERGMADIAALRICANRRHVSFHDQDRTVRELYDSIGSAAK